jgi:protein-S-isoprenylcysteine O-methyltransferase Ste14
MRRRPRPIHLVIWFCFAAIFVGGSAWAWGDWRGLFAHPARAGAFAVWGCLAVVALFSGASSLSAGKREDRGNRWVLAALAGASLLLVFVPPYTDRRGIWTLDGNLVRYAGLAIFVAGGVLRLSAVYTLGHRFSGLVAIQENHQLATGGLYRVIRHPAYLGAFVLLLGWVLIFRSGIGLILLALLVLALVGRIRAEEAFLASEFGEEYAEYRRHTWRLIPHVY